MTRHVSGTYRRTDRVRPLAGSSVRLRTEGQKSARVVSLLEFSLSDMLLSSSTLPAIGSFVFVSIALPDRNIEFDLPAVVAWHRENEFALVLEYLTPRQTFGLTLALELARQSTARAEANRAPSKTGSTGTR